MMVRSSSVWRKGNVSTSEQSEEEESDSRVTSPEGFSDAVYNFEKPRVEGFRRMSDWKGTLPAITYDIYLSAEMRT